MIKAILLSLFIGIISVGCAHKGSVRNIRNFDQELQYWVKNSVLIAKDLRGNPNNEGGNETTIYNPSTYFNPDPEFVADQRPVWMRHPEKAHIFLVCVIASDHGFDQNSWSAFFKAFEQDQKTKILHAADSVGELAYTKLCIKYGYAPCLRYSEYRRKFERLKASMGSSMGSGVAFQQNGIDVVPECVLP